MEQVVNSAIDTGVAVFCGGFAMLPAKAAALYAAGVACVLTFTLAKAWRSRR